MTHSQAMFLLRTGALLAYGRFRHALPVTYQAEIAARRRRRCRRDELSERPTGGRWHCCAAAPGGGCRRAQPRAAVARLRPDRPRLANRHIYPTVTPVAAGAQAVPPPTPVQQNLAHAAPAFNALKAYAAAVSAVAAAADDAALTRTHRAWAPPPTDWPRSWQNRSRRPTAKRRLLRQTASSLRPTA